MAIYGIAGKKQHGKNTVAKIWKLLYKYHSFDSSSPVRLKYKTDEEWIKHVLNSDVHKTCDWQEKAYADKLKKIVCLLLGCTREQLEDNDFKESPLGDQWTKYRVWNKVGFLQYFSTREEAEKTFNAFAIGNAFIAEEILTPRLLLQLLGTQCGREVIHPEIWVNALFADYDRDTEYGDTELSKYDDPDDWWHSEESVNGLNPEIINPNKWLITDVRFPNEVEAIQERDGKIIRINRINHKQYVEYNGQMVVAYDVHPSETALDNYDGFDYVIEATGTAEDLIPKVKAIMIKEGIINGTD